MDERVQKLRGGTLTEVHEVLDSARKRSENVSPQFLDSLVDFVLSGLERLRAKWTGVQVDDPTIRLDPYSGTRADWIDYVSLVEKALDVLERIDPSMDGTVLCGLRDPHIRTWGGELNSMMVDAHREAVQSVEVALRCLAGSKNPRIAGPVKRAIAHLQR